MADWLLQLFYFLRPLMFVYIDASFLGMGVFELFTIALIGILFLAFLLAPPGPMRYLDRLDYAMIGLIGWCAFVTLIQWSSSDWKASLKWALPFLIYMLLRRMIRSERDYLKFLRAQIAGFSIIVTINAVAIWQGRGFSGANWFTGIERYHGVFQGVHTMSHTVGFALMLVGLYFALARAWRGPAAWRDHKFITLLSAVILPLAVYSIIKGNVRTVMVGVVIFFAVLLFLTNRKQFYLFSTAVVAVWALSPFIQAVFWDATSGVGVGTATEMAGSGRPFIWKHNLSMYADLPVEQQIMGLGVGNEIGIMPANGIITSEFRNRAWESHNDFLSALMELGIVGFGLVCAIFWYLFQNIRRLPGGLRSPFMALFLAVVVMNFLSNSYLNRFGLGQLFVMVMVGVDVIRHSTVPRGAGIPVGRVSQVMGLPRHTLGRRQA